MVPPGGMTDCFASRLAKTADKSTTPGQSRLCPYVRSSPAPADLKWTPDDATATSTGGYAHAVIGKM